MNTFNRHAAAVVMMLLLFLGLGTFSGCPLLWPPAPEYVISIEREAANEYETWVIAQAEGFCPSRQAVLEVFEGEPPGEDEGCLWWVSVYDGFKFPFAITGDAIDYFVAEVESRREARVPYHAALRYHAWVEIPPPDDNTPATHVVRMTLDYQQGLRGIWIERTVVFDSEGVVLAVLGDGSADLWVI